MSELHQISFMPWAGFDKSVNIGPVTFWPYRTEADNRINDSSLKSYLARYFRSYVDNKGQPVDSITVCSYENRNFLELRKDKRVES